MDDPVLFNRLVLGRTLWSKQVEVCRSVVDNPITLVPAGRAVGKSFMLAGLALWWIYTRKNALVITTGPDHRQVVSVLWKEIRRAMAQAAEANPSYPLDVGHLTAGYGSPQRLDVPDRGSMIGFACATTEGLSGQHAENMLVIVDESSGVKDEIWEAIFGAAASRYIFVGNPIRYDCKFRELHDLAEKGSPDIHSVRISSLDSPDAALEDSPRGMASASFLRQMREVNGEGSQWWRSNILGFFPGQESVKFIPTAWIDACTSEAVLDDALWQDYPPGPVWVGVDVGGGVGADRSCVVVRDNRRILDVFASEWHGVLDDARHRLEPEVVRLARKWGVPGERVIYDKGGPGRNFDSYLANHGLAGAVGYFGAGRGGKLYVNRRTANAFAIRRRLDPNRKGFVPFYTGGIAEWPKLRQELTELRSPTMEVDTEGVKQKLEDKADMAARLHRSPDVLDAFLMTFTYSE